MYVYIWQVIYIKPVVTFYVNITIVQKLEYDYEGKTTSDYSGKFERVCVIVSLTCIYIYI